MEHKDFFSKWLIGLQNYYELTPADMGHRSLITDKYIETWNSKNVSMSGTLPCLEVSLRGLTFDGRDLSDCSHGGQTCDDRFRFHGTRDLAGILQTNGIQAPRPADTGRELDKFRGWYHFEAALWSECIQYAHPQRCWGMNETSRVVLIYECRCRNACGGRRWRRTQWSCRRYCLTAMRILRAADLAPITSTFFESYHQR